MIGRLPAVALLAVFATASAFAAAPQPCTACIGVVLRADVVPSSGIPVLVTDVSTIGITFSEMNAELRRNWTMLINVNVSSAGDENAQIDSQIKTYVDWISTRGSMAGFGVAFNGADAAGIVHGLQTLSTAMSGRDIAPKVVLRAADVDQVAAVEAAGGGPYFDSVVLDASQVATAFAWFASNDPGKRVEAIVSPQSQNTAYDLARALADGASTVYLGDTAYVAGMIDFSDYTALANFYAALSGEFQAAAPGTAVALDGAQNLADTPLVAFARPTDSRMIVVPRDPVAYVSIAVPGYAHAAAVNADGTTPLATSVDRGHLTISVPPLKRPFIIVIDHAHSRRRPA